MLVENPYLISEVMEALVNKMKDHGLDNLVHPDTYTDRLSAGLVKTGDHLTLLRHSGVMNAVYGAGNGQAKSVQLMAWHEAGEHKMMWEDLAVALGVRTTIDDSQVGQP